MKEYSLNTNRREPRPRSRRLRELGGTASGGTNSTTIVAAGGGSGSGQADPNSHWHDNKATLDSISVDTNGYEWITTLTESGDTYVEHKDKVKAGYSDMAYDLAEDSPANNRFVSRLKDDVVKGNITFEQAIDVLGKAIVRKTLQVLGDAEMAGALSVGKALDVAGNTAVGGNASIQGQTTIGGDASVAGSVSVGGYEAGRQGARISSMGDAELLSLVIRSLMRSPDFRAGFAGEGWRLALEDGLAKLEVDDLTVRRVMHIFELVIEKIRSVGGQIVVSAANGKIKKVVEQVTGSYRIYFEGDNQFRAHDLMRCQTFTGKELRGYWVEVSYAATDCIVVDMSEFRGFAEPKEGDECVLMGNTTDTARQNLILISATEDGQPRVDVMDGVHDKHFTGCLRARLGNLDGITDSRFPADRQPHGDGLYADNAYLKGTFLLETGEDVRTRFEIMEGMVSSAVEAVRQDSVPETCYITNPTFKDGMTHWTTNQGAIPYTLAGRWLWANGNILSMSGAQLARIINDEGRQVMHLRNANLIQRYADMDLANPPAFSSGSTGKLQPVKVYISITYRALEDGLLHIDFDNYKTTNFEPHATINAVYAIKKGDSYRQISPSGLWDGTGDLRIHCSGEVLISRVIMSTDRAGTLAYKYRTLFEQSDKMIKIAAENFDADGQVLESSAIVTTAEANAMFSQRFNDDGTLKNISGLVTTAGFAEMFSTAVAEDNNIVKQASIKTLITETKAKELISQAEITADQIRLEGLVTANDNFKILQDGSIETTNGKFTGEVNATKGTFTNVTVSGLLLHPAQMLEKGTDGNVTVVSGDATIITLPTGNEGDEAIRQLNISTSGFEKVGRIIKIYNPSTLECTVCTFTKFQSYYGYVVNPNEIIELTCVHWRDPSDNYYKKYRWILTSRQDVNKYLPAITWKL